VFIIGEVAAHDAAWSWFEKRPLFGQSVLVTRPLDQAGDLARPLAEMGANVLTQPAIHILPPQQRNRIEPSSLTIEQRQGDWSHVDRTIELLDRFQWLVFSSANGVRFFLDRLPAMKRDVRVLRNLKIAAIGSATAAELAKYQLQADLIPDEFRAESLAKALAGGAAGNHFLLIRASRGREILADELTAAGGHVEQVVAYESIDVATPDPQIAAQMAAGQIHWTTVTSSAIARSLANLFGDSLRQTKLVSISPITSAVLRDLGYEPAAEATEYTMAGLVQAIQRSI
jgi:uroporphyrinogen III methyltransferase/synthase